MAIEGVLLTGGRSARMGTDKAALPVGDGTLAERIAEALAEVCSKVTVLGSLEIPGCRLQKDQEAFAGPLAALARFEPTEELVFVASCDLPRFEGRIVAALNSLIGEADAAIPVLEGRSQPLCALYRGNVFEALANAHRSGERSIQKAFSGLTVCLADETDLSAHGVDPKCVQGANTPEEFAKLVGER